MRSTVRIDDDLMTTVKTRARGEGVSMTRMLNRVVRLGLESLSLDAGKPVPYREATFRMGQPRVNLDKALALAATLEDDEALRKVELRK